MTAADRHADTVRAELDTVLRYAVAIGALLVLMLPAARGHHGALGWLPLWLVAMPAMAWWALHRFALPLRARRVADPVAAGLRRRRRGAVQARRRARGPAGVRAWPRAA